MKIKMPLECVIPPEQKIEYGKLLAAENQRSSQLESEMKASNKRYQSQISECESQIQRYSQLVSTGREMKDVNCEVKYNSPDEGYKQIFRLDTGERVRLEPMTTSELEDLFINGIGLHTDEDGAERFVFKDKRSVNVVNRDADNYSAIGWKTINGPIEDFDMVNQVLENDSDFRIVKGKAQGSAMLFILQKKEEVKALPEAKPEKKKASKKETAAAAVATPERCEFVHEKTGLRCVLDKGHDGICEPNACKHSDDDGKSVCILVKGHEGDHKFMNREELKG